MPRRLPMINLQPTHFVGRLLYLTRWLLAPEKADGIACMVLRVPEEAEESAFERTGELPDAVQLARASFVAEALFHDTMLEYTDLLALELPYAQPTHHAADIDCWGHADPIYGSDVVWAHFCWLLSMLLGRCQDGKPWHVSLDPVVAESFERRLDDYLHDTYAWWYAETPTTQNAETIVNMSPSLMRLKESLERLFTALDGFNTSPYHSLYLLEGFYHVVRSYHEVYSAVADALMHKWERQLGGNTVSFPRMVEHFADNDASRIMARLAYVVASMEACRMSGLDEINSHRLAEFLSKNYKLTQLLFSLIGVEQFHLDKLESETAFEGRFVTRLASFWEWYTESALLPLDTVLFPIDQSLVNAIDTKISALLTQNPLWTLGDRTLLTLPTETSMPRSAIGIARWLQQFAISPFHPLDLLQRIHELEGHIWTTFDSLLLKAIAQVR